MKHLHRLVFVLALCSMRASGQDTFSIVAVDTVTGEIGSAGASCVGAINGVGAFILSDVIEGRGAIHTQASWLSANQQTAHNQMLLGLSPQEIIDYMILHDAQNNPTIRQYGIVDLTRRGESAAYTGVNCTNYKNHATGPGWAVQGNILSGQAIIDTMRNTFLSTSLLPLADRLMAALEAAKIIGADTRCASRGTSSRSSFVKVVRIGDGNSPYLQRVVPDSPVGVDPIDLLRVSYDQWKDSLSHVVDPFRSTVTSDRDTLPANGTAQAVLTIVPRNNSDSLLSSGRTILVSNTGAGQVGPVTDLGNGTYAATITAPGTPGYDTIGVRVVSGSDTVRFAMKPVIIYVAATGVKNQEMTTGTYRLSQNFPNPFNPYSRVEFFLPEAGHVTIRVYDVTGREVAILADEVRTAGEHHLVVDGSVLSSGTYYYQLRGGSFTATRQMVLVK